MALLFFLLEMDGMDRGNGRLVPWIVDGPGPHIPCVQLGVLSHREPTQIKIFWTTPLNQMNGDRAVSLWIPVFSCRTDEDRRQDLELMDWQMLYVQGQIDCYTT